MVKKEPKLAILGVGHVGLSLSLVFCKKFHVLAFDINKDRIQKLKEGVDKNLVASNGDLKNANLSFSSDAADLKDIDCYIIAVPTPINEETKKPDISYVVGAGEIIGKYIKNGDIVVLESTVYPGLTEEDLLPVLEKKSNKKAGIDFYLGYSPERVNPGDHEHKLNEIPKILSGLNAQSLEHIKKIYSKVFAKTHCVASIKIAEMAKLLENVQRDVNIGLMNEVSQFAEKYGINLHEVIDAASTKWNFMRVYPGLVGGHCIAVDPYYLLDRGTKEHVDLNIVADARSVNEELIDRIYNVILFKLKSNNLELKNSSVAILGLTFKSNYKDVRNAPIFHLIDKLLETAKNVVISDPLIESDDLPEKYKKHFAKLENIKDIHVLVLAKAHKDYVVLDKDYLFKKLVSPKIIIDIEYVIQDSDIDKDVDVWRL